MDIIIVPAVWRHLAIGIFFFLQVIPRTRRVELVFVPRLLEYNLYRETDLYPLKVVFRFLAAFLSLSASLRGQGTKVRRSAGQHGPPPERKRSTLAGHVRRCVARHSYLAETIRAPPERMNMSFMATATVMCLLCVDAFMIAFETSQKLDGRSRGS